MKKINYFLVAGILSFAFLLGCKRDVKNLTTDQGVQSGAKPNPQPAGSNCGNYDVKLTVTYESGTTVFVWKITNPNPGNGTGTTIQNLSHWDFVANACDDPNKGLEQNWSDVVAAYYTTDPSTWTQILPTPQIQPDPSIKACTTADLVKFDHGTSGSTPTYYKLVLAGSWDKANTTAWFKSGANTGCCSKTVEGVGCKQNFCSYSQGFFFAKPDEVWPGSLQLGGFWYTQTEGNAIWNFSNAGGIRDSKKAFTQAAAIKLSQMQFGSSVPQSVLDDVAIIETYLSGLGQKLSGSAPVFLPTGTAGSSAAAAAAGRIGDWINEHHCTNDVLSK
jgi:hypothetical protein